jgi:hypothetical protein
MMIGKILPEKPQKGSCLGNYLKDQKLLTWNKGDNREFEE